MELRGAQRADMIARRALYRIWERGKSCKGYERYIEGQGFKGGSAASRQSKKVRGKVVETDGITPRWEHAT